MADQKSTTARTALDPLVLRVLVGVVLSAVGSGLTLPFLYVYLTEVRDLPAPAVGLVFAWMGAVAFVLAIGSGTLIDRIGPRLVMIGGLSLQAAGTAAWGWVTGVPEAFLVASLITAGIVMWRPANNALLTRMVDVSQRERIYGLRFMLMNAGLGVGGLIASVIVSLGSVASFQRLYLIDAATYLVLVAVMITLPRTTGLVAQRPDAPQTDVVPGGWSVVLRDTTMVRYIAIVIVLLTFGYAQVEAGFTAFSVTVAGIAPRYLGWAFAANTLVIVVGQMLALRFIRGRARTRMLATAAAVWSVSWVVIGFAGVLSGWWAVGMVVGGLGVFGIAETLWSPVAPAVTNALAPEELRGRYNSLGSMAFSISGILGPALAGTLFGAGLSGLWLGLTIGGTALAVPLLLGLGRRLSAEQNGLVTG